MIAGEVCDAADSSGSASLGSFGENDVLNQINLGLVYKIRRVSRTNSQI